MKRLLGVLVVSLLVAALSASPVNADASQNGCLHSDGRAAGCSNGDKKTDKRSNSTKKADHDRDIDDHSNSDHNRDAIKGFETTDRDLKSDMDLLTGKDTPTRSVPEPGSLSLMAVGIAGIAGLALALSRRRSFGN